MLTIYRRHLKSCLHRGEGRAYRRCRCPIHVEGLLGREEIRRSTGLRDWGKAQNLVREWESGGREAAPAESGPVTIEHAWEQFLADAEARKLNEATIYKYQLLKRQLEEFSRQNGLRFLAELDLDTLGRFRAAWTEGPCTSSKKLERLRAFLSFAQERGWITSNPARKLKAPRIPVRPTLPFTHEEMVKILAALDDYARSTCGPRPRALSPNGRDNARRLRALVLLLRYSGMRIGDAVGLSADRIVGNRLFLYTQKTGVPVSTVLPDFVVSALESTPRMTERYPFWTGAGKLNTAVRVWETRLRRLFRIAGIAGGHAHRFRDTLAVALLLAGVPLERVSVLLGHQTIRVTERHYAPWVRERQEQLEADLERVFSQDPVVLLQTKHTRGTHGKERVQ